MYERGSGRGEIRLRECGGGGGGRDSDGQVLGGRKR